MAKIAVEKMSLSDDGYFKNILVDAESGQEIPEDLLDQYTLLTPSTDGFTSQLRELGISNDIELDEDMPKSKSELKMDEWKRERDPQKSYESPSKMDRSVNNNYGFTDQPKQLGWMSVLPGPAGVVGRIGTAAIGLSNRYAINQARKSLGMQDSPSGNAAQRAKGYVGDITYNGVTSPVGLRAEDAQGRTTLTPNEARMRMALSGARPATKEEVTRERQMFKDETGMAEPSLGSTIAKEGLKTVGRGLLSAGISAVMPGPVGAVANVVAGKFLNDAVDQGGLAKLTQGRRPPSESTPQPTVAASWSERRGLLDRSNVDPTTDLEDRPLANISYNMGPNRPNVPTGGIAERIQRAVTNSLGPGYTVSLTSGQENPGDQYGSNRHKTGLAADVKLYDPQGNPVTDPNAMKAVAQEMAGAYNANVGYGPEYMGLSTMHVDTVDPETFTSGQSAQWGSYGKKWGPELASIREDEGAYGFGPAPTPDAKPMQTTPSFVGNNSAYGNVNFSRINQMDDKAKTAMALTLAGEIDPTKTDLSTPEGIREAQGILSTMENRIAAYGSVVDALGAPNQYSTWNTPEQAKTAIQNYASNPESYNRLVDSYAKDERQNLGFTSYHANTVNPSWSQKMTDVENIGPHKFGTVADLSASKLASGFGRNFGQFGMTQDTIQQQNAAPLAGAQAVAQGSLNLNQSAGYADESSQSGFAGSNQNTTSSTPASDASSSDSMGGGSRSDHAGGSIGGGSISGGSASTASSSGPTGGGFASSPSTPSGGTPSSGMTGTDKNPGKAADDAF